VRYDALTFGLHSFDEGGGALPVRDVSREGETLGVYNAELNEFRVNGHNRTCEEQLRLLCRVRFLQHESRGFD
jgi:hypothetical protein